MRAAAELGMRTVAIDATRTIRFTVQRIEVRAGEKVRIALHNSGEIPKERMAHNFVLLKKGTDPGVFVAAAGLQNGATAKRILVDGGVVADEVD